MFLFANLHLYSDNRNKYEQNLQVCNIIVHFERATKLSNPTNAWLATII